MVGDGGLVVTLLNILKLGLVVTLSNTLKLGLVITFLRNAVSLGVVTGLGGGVVVLPASTPRRRDRIISSAFCLSVGSPINRGQ